MNIIKNDIGDNQQEELAITADMVKSQCRKLPNLNWKAPGRDGVQGFWLKELRGLHERIAEQLNRKKCSGVKDQLLINKAILKDCKKRHTNLAMAWIDYRKAYDMLPHSWIGE